MSWKSAVQLSKPSLYPVRPCHAPMQAADKMALERLVIKKGAFKGDQVSAHLL